MGSIKGRLTVLGTAAIIGWAMIFGAGCSQDVEDDTAASGDRVTRANDLKAPGQSFVSIEYGDEIVGTIGGEENSIEATASRSFGIGAIGSYILHKKNGSVFGVITAYGRTDGKPKVELITNMETGQTAFAAGNGIEATIADAKGEVTAEFLTAFGQDLQAVQRTLPAGDVGTTSIHVNGFFDFMGGKCGVGMLKSLFAGVLGTAMFYGGAYSGGIFILAGAAGYETLALAALVGGGVGIFGGAAVAGVGVIALGVHAINCLRE